MNFYVTRHHKPTKYNVGTTPWGIFTNLWPTAANKRDREMCGKYLHIHAFGRTFQWCWI